MTKRELIDAIMAARPDDYDRSGLERVATHELRAIWGSIQRETLPQAAPALQRDTDVPPMVPASSDPWSVMAAQIAPHLPRPTVDTDAIEARIAAMAVDAETRLDAKIAKLSAPTRFEVKRYDGTVKPVGIQHRQFPELMRRLTTAPVQHVWLYGAPGGGKTHVAKAIADALDLDFRFVAFSSQTTVTNLAGFKDANGGIVPTVIREAAEHGGILLIDEGDKASPAVVAALHAMLSQGQLATPDGHVDCHESLRVILAANTAGLGGTHGHESAMQADTAFRDRFSFLEWEYDEALERALALAINPQAGPWIDWTLAVRAGIAQRSREWRLTCTPRTTYGIAADARAADVPARVIADAWLFRGCDPQTRDQIIAAHPFPKVTRR